MPRNTKTVETPETPEVETPTAEATPAETKPSAEERRATKKMEIQESRVMDSALVNWVATHARPALAPCLCGCGGETKGRFVPGHDALLKVRLEATAALGSETQQQDAHAALTAFGW